MAGVQSVVLSLSKDLPTLASKAATAPLRDNKSLGFTFVRPGEFFFGKRIGEFLRKIALK
jgi:hypothetical protein